MSAKTLETIGEALTCQVALMRLLLTSLADERAVIGDGDGSRLLDVLEERLSLMSAFEERGRTLIDAVKELIEGEGGRFEERYRSHLQLLALLLEWLDDEAVEVAFLCNQAMALLKEIERCNLANGALLKEAPSVMVRQLQVEKKKTTAIALIERELL